jgi:hypothetical protein
LHEGSNQITFEECEREKGRNSFFQELKNMGYGVLDEE